jgi:hypothetical protein
LKTEIRLGFLGVARNCSTTLSSSIQKFVDAAKPLSFMWWYVVESDSSDGSIRKLAQLQEKLPGFSYLSLGMLEELMPDRVQRIRFCREKARTHLNVLPEVDFVVIADLDGPALSLQAFDISSSISRMEEISEMAIFTANSTKRYFDIFALRCTGWVEKDYRELEADYLEGGTQPLRAKYLAQIKPQKRIRRGTALVKVNSAFGGLAIYPWDALKQASYLSPGSGACEHVKLNDDLRKLGYEIWIDPNLRVRPNLKHSFFGSSWLRPVWLLLSILPMKMATSIRRLIP